MSFKVPLIKSSLGFYLGFYLVTWGFTKFITSKFDKFSWPCHKWSLLWIISNVVCLNSLDYIFIHKDVRCANKTPLQPGDIIIYIRHFRSKLVHWNENIYCTLIDRALKMRFNEGLAAFYDQPFLSYERFCKTNCAAFWTK